MSKPPSEKTLLERARREIRQMEKEFSTLRAELVAERMRASKAEGRAREWENRFDELLAAFKGPLQSPSTAANANG